MRHVSWVSDSGLTVTFEGRGPHDGGGPFFFRELTSDLGATAESSRAPRQDGATTWHVALDSITINLTGSMLVWGDREHPARALYDRQRAHLHQALAPHRWGTLTYYKEDGAVQIRCRPVATPTVGTPVGTYSTLDVTFTSDAPCWETAEEYILCMGVIQRFFHFPWSPVAAPLGAFNRFVTVQNPTQEAVYPQAEVYSTGQFITLSNRSTGKFVTIEHAIGPGQKLTVNLRDVSAFLWTQDAQGDYSISEDVSHWMSLDSEPWGLQPGYNQIAVTNDVPEDTPLSYIRYRIPSLGI